MPRFIVEYAKSDRGKCSLCSRFIRQFDLRLGVLTFNSYSGGLSPVWSHISCYTTPIVSSSLIEGLFNLSWSDQEKVRSICLNSKDYDTLYSNHPSVSSLIPLGHLLTPGSSTSLASRNDYINTTHPTGLSASEILQVCSARSNKLKAERSSTNRAKCRACKGIITSGSLRLGWVIKEPSSPTPFPIPLWHHAQCFFDKDELPSTPNSFDQFHRLSPAIQTQISTGLYKALVDRFQALIGDSKPTSVIDIVPVIKDKEVKKSKNLTPFVHNKNNMNIMEGSNNSNEISKFQRFITLVLRDFTPENLIALELHVTQFLEYDKDNNTSFLGLGETLCFLHNKFTTHFSSFSVNRIRELTSLVSWQSYPPLVLLNDENSVQPPLVPVKNRLKADLLNSFVNTLLLGPIATENENIIYAKNQARSIQSDESDDLFPLHDSENEDDQNPSHNIDEIIIEQNLPSSRRSTRATRSRVLEQEQKKAAKKAVQQLQDFDRLKDEMTRFSFAFFHSIERGLQDNSVFTSVSVESYQITASCLIKSVFQHVRDMHKIIQTLTYYQAQKEAKYLTDGFPTTLKGHALRQLQTYFDRRERALCTIRASFLRQGCKPYTMDMFVNSGHSTFNVQDLLEVSAPKYSIGWQSAVPTAFHRIRACLILHGCPTNLFFSQNLRTSSYCEISQIDISYAELEDILAEVLTLGIAPICPEEQCKGGLLRLNPVTGDFFCFGGKLNEWTNCAVRIKTFQLLPSHNCHDDEQAEDSCANWSLPPRSFKDSDNTIGENNGSVNDNLSSSNRISATRDAVCGSLDKCTIDDDYQKEKDSKGLLMPFTPFHGLTLASLPSFSFVLYIMQIFSFTLSRSGEDFNVARTMATSLGVKKETDQNLHVATMKDEEENRHETKAESVSLLSQYFIEFFENGVLFQSSFRDFFAKMASSTSTSSSEHAKGFGSESSLIHARNTLRNIFLLALIEKASPLVMFFELLHAFRPVIASNDIMEISDRGNVKQFEPENIRATITKIVECHSQKHKENVSMHCTPLAALEEFRTLASALHLSEVVFGTFSEQQSRVQIDPLALWGVTTDNNSVLEKYIQMKLPLQAPLWALQFMASNGVKDDPSFSTSQESSVVMTDSDANFASISSVSRPAFSPTRHDADFVTNDADFVTNDANTNMVDVKDEGILIKDASNTTPRCILFDPALTDIIHPTHTFQAREVISKGRASIDPSAGIDCVARMHVHCDKDCVWSASMVSVDLEKGLNSMYKLQLLVSDTSSRDIIVFRAWGEVGKCVNHISSSHGSLLQAKERFSQIYFEKTGMNWIEIGLGNCVPFPFVRTYSSQIAPSSDKPIRKKREGRYIPVDAVFASSLGNEHGYDMSLESKSDIERILEAETDTNEESPSKENEIDTSLIKSVLPRRVRQFIAKIFDQTDSKVGLFPILVDSARFPIDVLSPSRISVGIRTLFEIEQIFNKIVEYSHSITFSQSEILLKNAILGLKVTDQRRALLLGSLNKFYSLIPHQIETTETTIDVEGEKTLTSSHAKGLTKQNPFETTFALLTRSSLSHMLRKLLSMFSLLISLEAFSLDGLLALAKEHDFYTMQYLRTLRSQKQVDIMEPVATDNLFSFRELYRDFPIGEYILHRILSDAFALILQRPTLADMATVSHNDSSSLVTDFVITKMEKTLEGFRANARLLPTQSQLTAFFLDSIAPSKVLAIPNFPFLEQNIIQNISRDISQSLHPFDRRFRSLGVNLHELDPTSHEYATISKYLHENNATSKEKYSLEISDILSVQRPGEKERYDEYVNTHLRASLSLFSDNISPSFTGVGQEGKCLLWHGSRSVNLGNILSQGLRIAPPEAIRTGAMFGNGIYFADMSSKSANYTGVTPSSTMNEGFLLLCEVALGVPQRRTDAFYVHNLTKGFHCTLGVGITRPTPSSHVSLNAVFPKIQLTREQDDIREEDGLEEKRDEDEGQVFLPIGLPRSNPDFITTKVNEIREKCMKQYNQIFAANQKATLIQREEQDQKEKENPDHLTDLRRECEERGRIEANKFTQLHQADPTLPAVSGPFTNCPYLNYNEYVVYNPSQVQIRYIVNVKFKFGNTASR